MAFRFQLVGPKAVDGIRSFYFLTNRNSTLFNCPTFLSRDLIDMADMGVLGHFLSQKTNHLRNGRDE